MLKELCKKQNLKLNHDTPEDFTRCFWQKKLGVSLFWIFYRFLLVTYMTGGLIAICAKPTPGFVCKKSMIYFTHWAYVAQLVAFIFGLFLSVQRYWQLKKNRDLPPMEKMPAMYKASWVMYYMATPSALGVTIVFWVFIYDPEEYDTIIYTLLTHVFNSLTILLDFLLTGTPYRLVHIYIPWCFSFCYIAFSITYQLSGGTGNKGQIPVYTILDWRYPKVAAATCTMSLGCITIVHCAFCVINAVKHFFKNLSIRPLGVEPDEAP